MQVHYNLLGGPGPDRSATLLRLAPGKRQLTPLQTMLLPAPVELPCRPTHLDNPLCDRQKSIADVVRRFGPVGNTDNYLYLLCGGHPRESEVTSCTRTITQPTTIRAVAGHMHLLGRSIKIEVDPGTPHAHTVLDIPLWNFDNQGAKPIKPVRLEPGQQVKVTCRHVQWLRDQLPGVPGPAGPLRRVGRGHPPTRCAWASSPSPTPEAASRGGRSPRAGPAQPRHGQSVGRGTRRARSMGRLNDRDPTRLQGTRHVVVVPGSSTWSASSGPATTT